ncbi:MAG TPA: hypothetical protein VF783_16880 [Terriglobales bacterium]
MADEAKNGAKPFDPMEAFRGVRDAYMDIWAKSMVDMVNSEAYAQATGTMLDTYLTVSAPFRQAVEKAMVKTLEQMAMPSRADITSLAERMTHIELRLDDLDAKLDEFQKNAGKFGSSTAKAGTVSASKRGVRAKKAKRGRK